MNVYIFLISFSAVYFSFISPICCRRYERHYVGKNDGDRHSNSGLTDGQSGNRNLKPRKARMLSGIVGNEEDRFTIKRNGRTVGASKGTEKLNTSEALKIPAKTTHLREKKNRPHGHIATQETHKKRRSNYKAKSKTKKYSLAYAPSSSSTPQSQTEGGYQGYAPETSGQVRYLTNNPSNPGSDDQGSRGNFQFTNQQEGYQTSNGGQSEVNRFQENNNNGQERDQDKQSVGMLQALMEQKAVLGQQGNQQEETQRLPDQQETVAFQGTQEPNRESQLLRQEEDERQSAPQGGAEQFQQGFGRETPEQQMDVQEQGRQDGSNQDVNLQEGGEQGNVMQQGANQEAAAFQQGNDQLQDNGERRVGQMESSFQQENGPETVTQQAGNEQENYLQQGNEQELTPQHGEMQETTASYQQDNDQTGTDQHGESSEQKSTDVGSIANLFADTNTQGRGQEQDTQSLINEGQSITKGDASQLAAAIANANKGLTTSGEQNSLASLASNSAGALSFTEGEHASSNEGLGELGSSVNRFTPENRNNNQVANDFSLLDHQEENIQQKGDSFSQQYDQNRPSPSQSVDQEFMKFGGSSEHQHHVNTGIGNIAEDSVNIDNLDNSVANKAARYCTGCPRKARCIDKVCIINDDEPLAKILGALSGPEKVTDDCSGCHHHAKCIKKECICKPGFTGDGIECRADSCLPGCSKHGKCIRGFCVCDHHHYFNGVECSPYKIRHRTCPDKCIRNCLSECPERCCKSNQLAPPKPAEIKQTIKTTTAATTPTPTTKPAMKPTNTSNKKIGQDAAADFYLKPTLHNDADVFNKNLHQDKLLHSSNQSISSHLSSAKKGNTVSDNKNNSSKLLKPQSGDKNDKQVEHTKDDCHSECSGEKCSPSCPDHCCLVTRPSTSQIDFLKTFAEKFCPSVCQSKCQNTCPPICCEKRSFSSILKSSGASDVNVNKAEDVFRNAMGWFGMMNFLHMMYNMYGNTYKQKNMMSMNNPQNAVANAFLKIRGDQNAKTKTEVPGNPYAALPCNPICSKSCLSTCPPICCSKKPYSLQTKSQSIPKTLTKIGQSLHGVTCPSTCATLCSPTCPPSCCLRPQVPKASVATQSTSNYTSPSCKTGCSPKCYPLCLDSCCKAIQRTIQVRPTTKSSVPVTTPAKLKYGCPLQCPKSCFPSCNRDCCFAAEQYKPGLLNGHGQYMVSIPCPMECRPYNCLSYCHHECCLRTNNSYPRLKSYTTNSKVPINKGTSSSKTWSGSRVNNKLEKLPQVKSQKKYSPTNRKDTQKTSVNP